MLLIRAPAEIAHGNAIAAFIVIDRGIEGHMEITDKVSEVAKRVGAFARGGVLVFQDGQLIGDGFCNTTA